MLISLRAPSTVCNSLIGSKTNSRVASIKRLLKNSSAVPLARYLIFGKQVVLYHFSNPLGPL